MKAADIKKLFDAGVSAEAIDKLIGMETKQEPEVKSEVKPEVKPAMDYDLLGKAINDAMKPMLEQMQAAALGGTNQPKEKTVEDIIGEIINPPKKDDAK